MKPLVFPGSSAGATEFKPPPLPDIAISGPEDAPAWQDGIRSPFARKPETRNAGQPASADQQGTNLTPAMIADPSRLPRWKRAIDLACCVVALPFLAFCTLIMVILDRWVSPGPVFFRQERVGHHGRRFKIYKFRTMNVGADSSVHQSYFKELIGTNAPMAKLDSSGDARLIPGAWFLRASGLDELPQIINVWRGEMSLVGPRPCIPGEFEQYVPWQRRRCDAKPGLTGLWQVSGKNRTTFEQMIHLDIRYSRDLSLWLDLKIIIMTVPCLLGQIRDTRRARKSRTKPGPQLAPVIPIDTASAPLPETSAPDGLSDAAVRRHWSSTRASLFTEIIRLRDTRGESQGTRSKG
jgi:lipopolysaccharide/colanic/teichoic acid biosynthesis glycosyltransferase